MCSQLRNKLSEESVLIIDEISMVSNLLLLYIHQRLVQARRFNPPWFESLDVNLINPLQEYEL